MVIRLKKGIRREKMRRQVAEVALFAIAKRQRLLAAILVFADEIDCARGRGGLL